MILPTISLSNDNPDDLLLKRFQQAYCWYEGRIPSEVEIKEKDRLLHEQAIRAYIERAEADQKAKIL